jgi:hypothetical protein
MEHRWGKRVNVDLAIRIAGRPYNVRQARLVNLNASGAYIRVCTDLRLLSRVQIALTLPQRLAQPTPVICAYIVRRDKDGVGLEWCEYGPRAVLELLRHAAPHRPARERTVAHGRYAASATTSAQPQSIAEA